MELIPIGDAARRLRLRPSALRYYDDRGLVRARTRQGGRRMYGRDELRRIAFLTLSQRLGIPLDTAAAVLDAPSTRWRATVQDQIADLERVVEQARGAVMLLTHALECPTGHPTHDCPTMIAALDRLLDGITVEQLGREQSAL